MEYRIEATQPAVVQSVREHGHHMVNGLKFELRDNRAISEPANDQKIKTFQGVTGYLLVRAEEPYDRVSDLSGEKIVLRDAKEPEPEAGTESAPEPAAPAPEETTVSETPAEPAAQESKPKPKRNTRNNTRKPKK